jgi:hypothetical protein
VIESYLDDSPVCNFPTISPPLGLVVYDLLLYDISPSHPLSPPHDISSSSLEDYSNQPGYNPIKHGKAHCRGKVGNQLAQRGSIPSGGWLGPAPARILDAFHLDIERASKLPQRRLIRRRYNQLDVTASLSFSISTREEMVHDLPRAVMGR